MKEKKVKATVKAPAKKEAVAAAVEKAPAATRGRKPAAAKEKAPTATKEKAVAAAAEKAPAATRGRKPAAAKEKAPAAEKTPAKAKPAEKAKASRKTPVKKAPAKKAPAKKEPVTFESIISDLKERTAGFDASGYQGFLAIQVTLKDMDKVFYVEIKDGRLSIEPYEYYDRQANIIMTSSNFVKMINGKLNKVLAFTTGKLKVDGDVGKASELSNLFGK